MAANLFTTVRKSLAVKILFSSILSNLVLFGQPIQAMVVNYYHNKNITIGANYSTNTYNNPSQVSNYIPSKGITPTSSLNLSDSYSDRENIFYALQEKGTIGKISEEDSENPYDNFFSVELPKDINIDEYDAILAYELYGLTNANQTTKSVNGHTSYGGKVIAISNEWISVSENLSVNQLNSGTNEIFFNRRVQENYQYSVKNVRIEITKKNLQEVQLSENILKNFNGSVYITGVVSNKSILSVYVLGNKIPVYNGIFEHVLKEIPSNFKNVEVSYTDTKGKLQSVHYPLIYSDENAKYDFKESHLEDKAIDYNLATAAVYDNLTVHIKQAIVADNKGRLIIEGLKFKDIKTSEDDLKNVTAGKFEAYHITKLNLADSVSMQLRIKYDSELIPDGYTANDIKTFYYDKQQHRWNALAVDSLDIANKEIIATSFNNDTDYINGVIKVPESPETGNFTPTTLSDIKFADPASGVVSIQPPSPNSTGVAATSFPIKLPGGRNGMQPSLQVSYNSEGGNSWMGIGWNLSTPAITLNTKWGAPLFNTAQESELYSLAGSDLVLMEGSTYTNPHRQDNIARSAERIFYHRKEGSYDKITRHGSNPTNYWWEVTDKMGNKTYYGGYKGSGLDTKAILTNTGQSGGNIAHWAITRVEDPFGNYIEYKYAKGQTTVGASSVIAQTFYPVTIRYTKHDRLNSYYEIQLNRNSYTVMPEGGNTNFTLRNDVIVNARNGYIGITNDLLTEVSVSFVQGNQSDRIRTYRFDYSDAAFQKKQLSTIAEYDADGNLFYSNSMEYYVEKNYETDAIIPSQTTTFSGLDDTFTSPLQFLSGVTAGLVPNGSPLGTSVSSGKSYGLRAGVGVGIKKTSVATTIGGAVNYGPSTQDTRISFIDLNGDGLPDKIFKAGDSVFYRKNTGTGFSEAISVSGNIVMSKTKSTTTGAGVDLNVGLNDAVGVGIGKSWSKTKSETDGYFTDFNGDGLPDLIQSGRVWFNDTSNGNQTDRNFISNVNDSENFIHSGSVNPSLISDLNLPTMDELRDEHPQFDHVKVWIVPYNGIIDINGIAKLSSFADILEQPNTFRLTVERTGAAQNIVTRTLSMSNQSTSINSYNLQVNKGDKIFFRIHNDGDGYGGEIEWNPQITYTSTSIMPFNSSNDDTNRQFNYYDSEQDFLINNDGIQNIQNGSLTVNYNLPVFAVPPTDDLNFVVKKIRVKLEDGAETILSTWQKTYNHITGAYNSNGGSFTDYINTPSGFKDIFHFYVESNSNIDWATVKWTPSYTSSADTVIHYPGVNYLIFDDNVNQVKYWVESNSLVEPVINSSSDESSSFLRLSHNLFDYEMQLDDIPEDQFPLKANWVTKGQSGNITKVLGTKIYYVYKTNAGNYIYTRSENQYNPVIPNIDNILDVNKKEIKNIIDSAGKIYSAFYINDSKLANSVTEIKLELHPVVTGYSFTPVIVAKPFMSVKPEVIGITHRGWGQFLYNGGIKFDHSNEGDITNLANNYGTDPIDTSLFDMQAQGNAAQNINWNSSIDNISPGDNTIRYINYNSKNEDQKYVNSSIVNSSYGYRDGHLTINVGRFGEKNLYELYIDPATLLLEDPGVFLGMKERSESKGSAVSGDFGVEIFGGSGTKSKATSDVLNQYVDINGDRYPDIVTKGQIQYTNMLGALSSKLINNNDRFVSGYENSDFTAGISIASEKPSSTRTPSAGGLTSVGSFSQLMNSSQKGVSALPNPTNTNVSAGINSGDGTSQNSKMWIDMNGDGLVDKVKVNEDSVHVWLNTGYGFSDIIVWGSNYSNLFVSRRDNVGGGLSFSKSFAFGFGATTGTAISTAMIIDVNGDSLPDLLIKTQGVYKYYVNTGRSFSESSTSFYNGDRIEEDKTVSGNVFAAYTNGFWFPSFIGPIKVVFTGSIGVNASYNEKINSIQDINGDGYVDVVSKGSNTNNSNVYAKLSSIGKTHLLKKVNTPLGGSWTIDYARNGNTYDLPQSKWVMTEIKTHDGFTGDNAFKPDATLTAVAYDKPKYDRREREFFGYETVTVQQKDPSTGSVFRTSISKYHNNNYYLSGAQKSTALYNQYGEKLSESTTLYNLLNPNSPTVNKTANEGINYLQASLISNGKALLDQSRLFVAVASTVSTSYEGSQSMATAKEFSRYDRHGNLTNYIDWGTDADDSFRTIIEYAGVSIIDNENGLGLPSKVSVYNNATNQLYREKRATYENSRLKRLFVKLNATEERNVVYVYDIYGNLTEVHDRDNLNATNAWFRTTINYDPTLQTFPVNVSNSFGETSYTQYDYLFGTPVLSTDKNGQSMRTRIDSRGRMVEVTGPNELALENGSSPSWTIRMEYKDEGAMPYTAPTTYRVPAHGNFTAEAPGAPQPTTRQHYAITRHFDAAYLQGNSNVSTNQLLTVSIVDGFGQAIQLKKNHEVNGVAKWMISGMELKDAFGRSLKSYLSSTQAMNTSADYTYFVPTTLPAFTAMSYDDKDRIKSVVQPGEDTAMQFMYTIQDGMLVQKTTNELSQTMDTYTDIRGRQRKMVQNNELTTTFEYNAINELMKVTDPQGFVTSTLYDQAGRTVEMQHPDRGVVKFKYSKSGNILEKSTSNLQLAGGLKVNYTYDFNRLTMVSYPQNPLNNVKYTYGSPSDNFAINEHAIGRLVQQEDATGVQVFGYGRMGEVTKNLRSVAVAGYQSYWFYTGWKYDSWNRIQEITYPDLEKVKYKYNSAGALKSISSTMNGISDVQSVIENIVYDDYGDRSSIEYGNGTVTNYSYDVRRRMNSLKNTFTNFEIKKNYTFDVLSNITNIATAQPQNSLPQPGQIGGTINQAYRYDNYNRLYKVGGQYTGANDAGTPDFNQHYEIEITYNPDHTIKKKSQNHYQRTIDGQQRLNRNNYVLDYSDYGTGAFTAGTGYAYTQPHAVRTIIESPDADYIPNNPPDAPLIKRKTISYDANGNQTEIKEKVGTLTTSLRKNLWDEENRLTAVDLKPDDKTGHPISIYTYDSSGERIVRYNSDRMDVSSNAGEIGQNAKDNIMIYPSGLIMGKVYHGLKKTDRSDQVSYTKHYYAGSERISAKTGTLTFLGEFPNALLASEMPNLNVSALRGVSTASVTDAGAIITGVYNKFGMTPPPLAPMVEENQTTTYHDPARLTISYFHPDHLGSSSYITNAAGIVTQHLEYMAFGEVFVEEHSNSLNSPFKFNGKELDGETGNYYYSARYYDPKLSIFISVDPLAEKTMSAYGYCYNNPVNLVDPTGMSADDPSTDVTKNKDGTYTVVGGNLNDGDKGIYVVGTDGKRTGEKIGESLTIGSFYNADFWDAKEGKKTGWVGTIDPNSHESGNLAANFIEKDADDTFILSYMYNATDGRKYDFKRNGDEDNQNRDFHHRGSIWGKKNDGTLVFGTARDAGNYSAGYIAAVNGLSWGLARKGFDGLEQYKSGHNEGLQSTLAQKAGFNYGIKIRNQRAESRDKPVYPYGALKF